ncbi:hypothetical protein B5E80_14480 [Flavonifractor sp. An135]|nr:pentapeptide repeat-containing protein [Flavonifractor sp. An135]OUQ22259.1 hypothetical protein B5E80_14480 [Flavonifractor sp. An135]
MKLEPPHIPAQTWEQDSRALERLLDREEVLSGCWEGCDLSGLDARGATLSGLWLKGCTLLECDFTGADLTDVRFTGCDLSGSRWEECGWYRCALEDCRALGAQFARSSLRAVSFTGCRLAGSGFAALRARQTLWKGCALSRCTLTAGQLKDVAFSDCDLTAAQLFRTPLNGIDLTSCRLDGLVLSDGAPELRGGHRGPLAGRGARPLFRAGAPGLMERTPAGTRFVPAGAFCVTGSQGG